MYKKTINTLMATPYHLVVGFLICLVVSLQIEAADIQYEIDQSSNDDRGYRYLELDNHLKVLLISDPAAPKAAASLDVNVGSGEDPVERAGIAHFLEHMLFLGTEKYPKVGEYHEFINVHGGSHNAYTSLEHTNYFFDISPRYLEEGLDRFAQFFVSPLFDGEYVEREKNAVNSEYRAKFKNEFRRSWDVYREISNPNNKTARFSVGSLETLADSADKKIRGDLLSFYQKYYSANIMTLTVLGTESLNELEVLVKKQFSAVKNHNVTLSEREQPFFKPDFAPAKVLIKPLKEQRRLSLIFPIPVFEQYYNEKPIGYISYMLGHEGKDSLFYALREKGWLESLSAGAGVSNRQSATFQISMNLTPVGYQHQSDIIAMVYQAIAQLKKDGIEKWRYNEQSVVASLTFRFQEKGDAMSYVSSLSNNLHYYAVKDVISGGVLMEEYNEKLIRDFVSYLRPDNMVVEVSANDVKVNKISQYYQTEYAVEKVPAEAVKAWQKMGIGSDVRSPLPNEFVAKQLKVKKQRGAQKKAPEKIKSLSNLRLWHLQSDAYNVPRGGVYVYARSVESVKGVKGAVLNNLFVAMLNRELNEYTYSASLAGLGLRLYSRSRGIGIELNGYSDKQGLLLKRVLDGVVSPTFKQQDFDRIKQEMIRVLENQSKEPPFRQLLGEFSTPLMKNGYARKQKLAALKTATLPDLQHFAKNWLRSINADAFVHGNFTESDAQKFAVLIESKLGLSGRLHHDPQVLVVNLEKQTKPALYPVSVDHADEALLRYYQANDTSIYSQAKMSLLGHMMSAAFFHKLRTEQQLGYIVFAGARSVVHVPGLMLVVQSPNYPATEISARIDTFLEGYSQQLSEMSDKEFTEYKQSLIDTLEEEPKNLAEEGGRFWNDITLRYLHFRHRQNLVLALSQTSKGTLQAFLTQQFLKQKSKPLTFVSESSNKKIKVEDFRNMEIVSDVDRFKSGKGYFVLK